MTVLNLALLSQEWTTLFGGTRTAIHLYFLPLSVVHSFMVHSFMKVKLDLCNQNRRRSDAYISLPLVRLGVHAGLPWIPGHLGHGEDEEGYTGEEEQDEARTSASKGPAIVVLHPNGLLALDHTFDRLPHHLQRDERAQACKCEEHAGRFEQVVPFFALTCAWA